MTVIAKSQKIYNIFLHIVVVALAVEVVILADQNSDLKSNPRPEKVRLQKGDQFNFQELTSLDPSHKIEGRGRKLFFVFTTTCQFCKINIEKWNKLASSLENTIPIVGVCLNTKEEAAKYALEHKLEFPVYLPVDVEQFKEKNKISEVPKTILCSEVGQVGEVWTGALADSTLNTIIQTTTGG